jgi:hypothetical protein
VEAVNKALYEQVEAAGASAATLALLGVATGQFTQEQAEAALKAAVLQEQIRAIAASVAAGDLSIGDALGQLNQAREALDASNLAAVAGTGEGGVRLPSPPTRQRPKAILTARRRNWTRLPVRSTSPR